MTTNTEVVGSSRTREKKIKNLNMKYSADRFMKYVFLISALISIASLVVITGFVFYMGLKPFLAEGYSLGAFLTGSEWVPSADLFGVAPMIAASLFATAGSIVIGTTVGILTAIFIAEIAPAKISGKISAAVELLAGIPSVLYGVFGLAVIVPGIQNIFNLLCKLGLQLLLLFLILKLLLVTSLLKVVLPAAKSGILAAVVLGIGRALGETMAVILVAGNSPAMPTSIMDSVRPLTTNIALEMGYAYGTHQEMLFATGVVLFTFILILNVVLNKLTKKAVK